MSKNYRYLLSGLLLLIGMTAQSCVEVKPYQRVYLDDNDMNMSDETIKSYENNFQNYRESATGGNTAKAGGGCGCN